MVSPQHSQHRRDAVCLTCGDKGESELLVYCRYCGDSAVHHYCLENFSPDDDDIKWRCWDCRGEDVVKDPGPLRRSERICFKRQKARDMGTYWKQKLALTSKDIHKTGRVAIDGHLPVIAPETNLVNARQRDLDVLEKQKLIPETVISSEQNESIRNDEPMVTANSNLPDKQEHHVESFDEPLEIPEFGNNEENMLLNSDNAQSDGKDFSLQVSLLAADNIPSTSDTLCRQLYLECDDSLSAEPIIAPVWRGRFSIKEGSEICVEMLAHVSNKACWKVSDAAAAMPTVLDINILEKHTIWPKHFSAAPPTPASIGLYFFPAYERDERVYDSLLDEVIDGDLALKVAIFDLELLIFPSSEFHIKHWRINKKYFLWGVFKKRQRSCLSTESGNSTRLLGHSGHTAIGNKEDLVGSQHPIPPSPLSLAYQSPVSLRSSQASNIPPSTENTPESLALDLSKPDKAVE